MALKSPGFKDNRLSSAPCSDQHWMPRFPVRRRLHIPGLMFWGFPVCSFCFVDWVVRFIPCSGFDKSMNLNRILPLTPDRWEDFEHLFGPRGACAGCWCMYWKLPRKQFNLGQGDHNRLAQKDIVSSGHIPGLIAYIDNSPVGWVAVEPRENYPVLANSRILKPLDELAGLVSYLFLCRKKLPKSGIIGSFAESGNRLCYETGRTSGGRLSGGTAPVREDATGVRLYWGSLSLQTSWFYRGRPSVRDSSNYALLYRN